MTRRDDERSSEVSTEDSLLRALAHAPVQPPLELAETRIWSDLPDGLWVDDKYRIQGEPLGRGAFGIVFRAWDEYLADYVALKILHGRGEGDEARVARIFQQAARAHHRLNHANIVGFRAWGFWGGAPYLVFELVKGVSLRQRLRDRALPLEEAVEIALRLADALEHAHTRGEPVYHQDLKPENVLITDDGQVKVLDFGLASLRRAWSDDESSETVSSVGTPRYMSPEQWRGETPGPSADLWALGLILFEMLAGEHPLVGVRSDSEIEARLLGERPLPSLSEAGSAVPPALVELVDRALSKDPRARFERASELRDALLRVAGRSPRPETAAEADGEPYRYLDPFREVDHARFFGRDRETSELVHLIDRHPVVLLLGPSGAGKTSLLQAGVIARLREDPCWKKVVTIRPGEDPLAALREALLASCHPASESLADQPADLVARLATGVLRAHARSLGGRILLVVDQFEELYTLVDEPTTRNLFVTSLVSGLQGAGDAVRVVIAGRSDFLEEIAQQSRGLWKMLHESLYLLAPPGQEQLRQALREPLRELGYEWADELVEEIVGSVGGEVAPLPFLQLTASQLWAERARFQRPLEGPPGRWLLPADALGALGGVSGVVTTYADRVVRGLPPQRTEVARIVLCSLVTEERARRRRDVAELRTLAGEPGHVDEVVRLLVRGRLLTSIQDSRGAEVVELAHEALLERWSTLRDWLDDISDLGRYRDHLRHSAKEWHEEGKRREMLWRGKHLREERRRTRRYRAPLTDVEREFLRASQKRSDRLTALVIVSVVVLALGAVPLGVVLTYLTPRNMLQGIMENLGGKKVVSYLFSDRPEFVLAGHRSPVLFAAFSPQPGWIATAARDGGVRVWNLAAEPLRPRVLRGHTSAVTHLVFSPDGASLLSSSSDGTANLWDVQSGSRLAVLGHQGAVRWGAFSPDGKRVATASADHTVKLWDANLSGTSRVLVGHQGAVVQVVFSHDGKRLLTASTDGTARLWTLDGHQPPVVLLGHKGALRQVAFVRDAETLRLLTVSDDGTAGLWTAAGKRLRTLEDRDSPVVRARFSAARRRILTLSRDLRVSLWLPDGRLKKRMREGVVIGGAPLRADFGGKTEEMIISTTEGVAFLGLHGWFEDILQAHTDKLTHSSLGPHGDLLVTTSLDGTALIHRRDKKWAHWQSGGTFFIQQRNIEDDSALRKRRRTHRRNGK